MLETDTAELVRRVIRGDEQALAELFSSYHQRLWRIVSFRLHHRLQGRVDADDILQEAWLNAVARIDHFLQGAAQSPFIWFRMIVGQTLIDVHRRHLGTQMRDASREVPLKSSSKSSSMSDTSVSLSHHLLGHLTSPSHAAVRAELSQELEAALTTMSDLDREVLALRHFEELSNAEAAQVLGLSEQAASLRYVRALARLKHIFESIPGYGDGAS